MANSCINPDGSSHIAEERVFPPRAEVMPDGAYEVCCHRWAASLRLCVSAHLCDQKFNQLARQLGRDPQTEEQHEQPRALPGPNLTVHRIRHKNDGPTETFVALSYGSAAHTAAGKSCFRPTRLIH